MRALRAAARIVLICDGELLLTGPQEEDALERGLVEDEVYWYDIVNVRKPVSFVSICPHLLLEGWHCSCSPLSYCFTALSSQPSVNRLSVWIVFQVSLHLNRELSAYTATLHTFTC